LYSKKRVLTPSGIHYKIATGTFYRVNAEEASRVFFYDEAEVNMAVGKWPI